MRRGDYLWHNMIRLYFIIALSIDSGVFLIITILKNTEYNEQLESTLPTPYGTYYSIYRSLL